MRIGSTITVISDSNSSSQRPHPLEMLPYQPGAGRDPVITLTPAFTFTTMSASSDSANFHDDGSGEKRVAGRSIAKKAAAPGFFGWVLPALRTRRTLKTWLHCVLTLAGAMTLLVDNAMLNSMGQAGFFAAIVAVLLLPSLALSVFMLASATLLLAGLRPGAAAHADKAWLTAREAAAEKSLVAGIGPALQLRILVFKSFFLLAVYGALFTLGTFVLGALRTRAPKLQLLCLFGTIVLDVVATTGPLLPTPSYTLPEIFLRPTVYYLAIAIAALVLVFPQTTALGTRPSDREAWAELGGGGLPACGLSGGLAALSGHIALIDLEVSVGRLGPADLKRLAPEVRGLGLRVA
ncbi:hypothetical protein C8R44DRAFT_894338 [Mycena epipterygia]|nr:hypothetical protein C8R44DRAFT_894338 [Mycena epipterygia]